MEYRGLQLDEFQVLSIEALQRGDNVLVAAPTGTGKTLVADWIVEHEISQGKTVVYTAPIKALSNQKFRDYCSLFGEEMVGLITGDLVIRREAPIKVMTTEILRNILLCGETIPDLSAVIVDEIHFLDDKERGTTWEEILIYLPKQVQVVGLSATLANLREFSEWFSYVRDREVSVVEEKKRAVPLSFFVATREGGIATMAKTKETFHRNKRKYKKKKSRENKRRRQYSTSHLDVYRLMGAQRMPYLYFVFSRARAEELAHSLGRTVKKPLVSPVEASEIEHRLQEFMKLPGAETALFPEHARLYRKGIAFHHAGVHVMLKAFVEELYEAKLIKVLYCTGTFALGINMPARSAVFDSLERYDGQGMIHLPTREFMQMAGRAGRRGMDDRGVVVIRMNLEDYYEYHDQVKKYLSSKYESVHSRFSLSFNSVANLLHRHPTDKIRELIEKSFLSWHRKRTSEKDSKIATQMELALQKAGLANTSPKNTKKEYQKIKRLRSKVRRRLNLTWEEFEERIEFLQVYNYVGEDLSFNAGAKALMHFQIQEIFSTELFLEGVFDTLKPALLFGVLCAMVVELPRNVTVFESRRYRNISKQIRKVYHSAIVADAAQITKLPTVWDGAMIPIGKAWAEGKSLAELQLLYSSTTDISGTLIGAFRRAKDLATQLRGAWKEFPDKSEMIISLIKQVSRDEVEVV